MPLLGKNSSLPQKSLRNLLTSRCALATIHAVSPQNSGETTRIGVLLDSGTLRFEMQRRGWQIKQLAAEANVSGATIRRILRGYPCFGTTLVAIAIRKAFDENPPRHDGLLGRRSA